MADGYTHAQWRVEATALVDALATVLVPGLEHMYSGLVQVGYQENAGQRARSKGWIDKVNELVTEGCLILDVHDPRLTRVSEAQAAAGGVAEVAADKRYSTRH